MGHPAAAEAGALASHALRVTGVALAGPMLADAEKLRIVGEFSALTRNLQFELQGGGARWAGSKFKGDITADGTLRGTWRHEDKTGCWLARHIGQHSVHNCLKPYVD